MALLKKLEDVRITKQNYFILQRNFYGELARRYPYIMKHNMARIANRLEYELHNMLCCSLKYKSIKIPLIANARWSNNGYEKSTVFVQRGCLGIFYHGSQRNTSDVDYLIKDQYLNSKDDMHTKYARKEYNSGNNNFKKIKEDHLLVKLSSLKKETKIIPEKLDFYFKILREVMIHKNKILEYVVNRGDDDDDDDASDYNVKHRRFNTDILHFSLNGKSFNVSSINRSTKSNDDHPSGYYGRSNQDGIDLCYRFNFISEPDNVLHLLDYNRNNSHSFERCFDKDIHDRLKYFISDYKIITNFLEKEEVRKKKIVKACYSFIKQLQIHTIPFKVLNKLK